MVPETCLLDDCCPASPSNETWDFDLDLRLLDVLGVRILEDLVTDFGVCGKGESLKGSEGKLRLLSFFSESC